jgi:ribosomal protein L11
VVQPLGIAVESDAEGNFKIAVPPGSYQLEISADAHERQQRPAQVERLGVTIVVVDLRRLGK